MPRKGHSGRKPLADPPVEKSLSLPGSLVAEVELRFYDPSTLKVRYGAFAALVERLLREWLAKGAPLATIEPAPGLPDDSPQGSAPPKGAGENP